MKITLHQIGKRFNRQWLFRKLDYSFQSGVSYAITGNNGSGKSTLLQIIYGYQRASEGNITHELDSAHAIKEEQVPQYSAFVAPYLELLEEFTLQETLEFHFQFKQLTEGTTINEVLSQSGLIDHKHKQIKFFSSGMKQRLKLALSLFNQSQLLLLDEPCSNLDQQGIEWYRSMLKEQLGKRTIIIASNQSFEYDFCDQVVRISDYQQAQK